MSAEGSGRAGNSESRHIKPMPTKHVSFQINQRRENVVETIIQEILKTSNHGPGD